MVQKYFLIKLYAPFSTFNRTLCKYLTNVQRIGCYWWPTFFRRIIVHACVVGNSETSTYLYDLVLLALLFVQQHSNEELQKMSSASKVRRIFCDVKEICYSEKFPTKKWNNIYLHWRQTGLNSKGAPIYRTSGRNTKSEAHICMISGRGIKTTGACGPVAPTSLAPLYICIQILVCACLALLSHFAKCKTLKVL